MKTHRKVAELVNHVVGIVCIADGIGTSQQHLERNVRDAVSHFFEALPWALVQESQADVEGRATPVLEGVQVVELVSDERRNFEQIVSSDASGQQRLMSVAESRVHQQKVLLASNRLREGSRTFSLQNVAQAGWRCCHCVSWNKKTVSWGSKQVNSVDAHDT